MGRGINQTSDWGDVGMRDSVELSLRPFRGALSLGLCSHLPAAEDPRPPSTSKVGGVGSCLPGAIALQGWSSRNSHLLCLE